MTTPDVSADSNSATSAHHSDGAPVDKAADLEVFRAVEVRFAREVDVALDVVVASAASQLHLGDHAERSLTARFAMDLSLAPSISMLGAMISLARYARLKQPDQFVGSASRTMA